MAQANYQEQTRNNRVINANESKVKRGDAELDIDLIHENTMRGVFNAGRVPDNSSFIYTDNNQFVKEGTPYHVHYTNDFEEFYMTGGKHQVTSRLIKPILPEYESDFSVYTNNFGKSYTPMADEFYKEGPSQEDYAAGSFIRYFVERRNDPSESLKEVDNEFDSPLYEKFSIEWTLTGNPTNVFRANRLAVSKLSIKHPRIKNVLNNFIEYYIIPEASELSKQRKALGITNIPKDKNGNIIVPAPTQSIPIKESNNESVPKKKRNTGGAMTGPPAGVMSGGAGGGGAY